MRFSLIFALYLGGVQLIMADLALDHSGPEAAAAGATARKIRTTKRLLPDASVGRQEEEDRSDNEVILIKDMVLKQLKSPDKFLGISKKIVDLFEPQNPSVVSAALADAVKDRVTGEMLRLCGLFVRVHIREQEHTNSAVETFARLRLKSSSELPPGTTQLGQDAIVVRALLKEWSMRGLAIKVHRASKAPASQEKAERVKAALFEEWCHVYNPEQLGEALKKAARRSDPPGDSAIVKVIVAEYRPYYEKRASELAVLDRLNELAKKSLK
uniref:RxLR effector candidate protein n=1 Tax=Peronospora matthiolae TaxID=2874970 RepID=A0AAV1UPH4_9STRA